jgi:hypothetical protein
MRYEMALASEPRGDWLAGAARASCGNRDIAARTSTDREGRGQERRGCPQIQVALRVAIARR